MQELRNYLGLLPYNELFLPLIHLNPILNWGYKKCTSEKLGKNTWRSPEGVGP
jgi:hypothetical protein